MPRRTWTPIAATLAVFLLWNLGASGALLLLPPPASVAAMLLLSWLVLDGLLRRRKPDRRRRAALLRLRPLPRQAWAWLLAAVPVSFVVQSSLGVVWGGLVPVPPEALNPFLEVWAKPGGPLAVALYAVLLAPVMEEVVFRGVVQGRLERRHGAGVALATASALFALMHALPPVLPLLLSLGLTFGFAVRATRSLLAAVLLHVTHNALTLAAHELAGPVETQATIWETGPTATWWAALGLLALSVAAGAWVGREMWRASRGRPAGGAEPA